MANTIIIMLNPVVFIVGQKLNKMKLKNKINGKETG